jgi:hypothetical protein
VVAWLLAVAALTAPVSAAQPAAGFPGAVAESERFTPAGGAPLDLRFVIDPDRMSRKSRLIAATHAALTTMSDWFGAPPTAQLTVIAVDCGPHSAIDLAQGAGTMAACVPWLAPIRDQRTERDLIRAVAREYWTVNGVRAGGFASSLVSYTANRAIHSQLEGSDFAAPRFFGGYVPFPLRSVLLSPPVNDPRPRVLQFGDAADVRPENARDVRALQTIERYVGWPSMLAALARLRISDASRWNTDGLGDILSDARGTDMHRLVDECFRNGAVFDYAIDSVQSRPAGEQVESTITIVRHGDARFSTSRDDSDRDAAIPVRVRFADGREIRDRIDGAAPSVALQYTAPAAVVGATVDPDVMLVLDGNRDNNSFVRDPQTSRLGVRLAMNWLAWLQNAMLSYTALL